MKFTKAGFILFTQNYEDCVDFYGRVVGLDLLHEIDRPGERLTTFALGDTYLMIETGGVGHDGPKPVEASPVKLRFNVPDVKASAEDLRRKGLAVQVNEYSWGTTAEFIDPDGNRCAVRSDDGFGE